MYRNRNLKKMLCMLLTFTLMVSGSALQVMALNPENGLQAAYQDVEAVGAGALEEDNSSETAEIISVPDAEQLTEEQYSMEDAESTDSSVGSPDDEVTDNTEHTSENVADEQSVEEAGPAGQFSHRQLSYRQQPYRQFPHRREQTGGESSGQCPK